MNSDVQNLLRIIKYTPLFVIIFACIFIIGLMYQEQEREFTKEKLYLKTQYIEIEKNKIRGTIDTIKKYIKNEKQKSEELLKEDLKRKINIVHKIATNIYNKNKNIFPKEIIIEQIKHAIETMRFNKGRVYFSIHTMEGINILQPINRKFEGTSVLNRKDAKGNYPIQNAIKIAKNQGEGFLSWYYFKPNDKSNEFKKIGIIKKFEPYNLIITTAEYVEDFEKNLQKKILNNISNLEYKNEGFIFIINYKGKIVLHESKKALNHNIFEDKNFSHVKYFFKNLISNKNLKTGDFLINKPSVTLGKDTKEVKITYAKKFEDWKWIVATSFKLSDANKFIEKRKVILEQKYTNYKKKVLIYGLVATLILLIISFIVAKLIELKFLVYKKRQDAQLKKELESKDELLRLKEEFNSFFELSINIQLISTNEGKILQINDAAKSMLGYEPEELINTSFIDLIHIDDIDKTLKEMGKLTAGKNVYFFENRYRHKEGMYINLAWSATTDKDHKLIYASAQNTTEARLLELEKKEKEKILYQQSKLAAMGEMIGNIAHQWRQPLSTITTASTGTKLQKEMDCLSDIQLYDALDVINNSAQHLSQTIDDFRGFFNPNNNNENEFNISDTLTKAINLVSAQFIAKDIEVIKDIESYNLISIENELIQVLINVLNNARDVLIAKEEGKRLIFINTYQKDNYSYIEISDSGGGISSDIIDRIFEPYFTTKYKAQGTGIGLYMSDEIIRTHLNGIITVENITYSHDAIEYKGAKFSIKMN